MLLFLIVLVFLWEKATLTASNCCAECPSQRMVRRQPGISYNVDCRISGNHEGNLSFYLNSSTPLNLKADMNLKGALNRALHIKNLTAAYEGWYSCSFGNMHPEIQECIYVLGIPKFLNCDQDSCVTNQTATAGQNVTLNFDIKYENGGCSNLQTELNLTESSDHEILEIGNYSYNCNTKIRHVQKTLSQVTCDNQGFYKLTMVAFDDSWTTVGRRRNLSINLSVHSTPRFLSCSEDTYCVIHATKGENVTLNFDIIGGCDDLDIELNLSELGNVTKLEPENYSYNSSTKIRHVQKTLSQVTLAHQGFYNLTMTHFNVDGTPIREELSISLIINEAPIGTTPTPLTSEESTNSAHVTQNVTTVSAGGTIPLTTFTAISVVLVSCMVIIITLIAIVLKKKKKSIGKKTENGMHTARILCPDTKKLFNSTTTISSGSNAMSALNSTDNAEILERNETIQTQGPMNVGSGILEEESRRRPGLDGIEQFEEGSLRLVERHESQQPNHYPLCLIGQKDHHCRITSSSSSSSSSSVNRISIISSPGDGNYFNFANYCSSERNI